MEHVRNDIALAQLGVRFPVEFQCCLVHDLDLDQRVVVGVEVRINIFALDWLEDYLIRRRQPGASNRIVVICSDLIFGICSAF